MIDKPLLDILWVAISAGLVFLMQAGFLCLETGLTRSKNNINVAIKNLADFGLSTVGYWAFGYAIMFGLTVGGWIGRTDFLLDFGQRGVWITTFFFFQVMFCGTTVTILSGAIAERVKFGAYLIIAGLVSAIIYPFFGHWAWNGISEGLAQGWLARRGFVDFAGSSVVHSVGGWAALAVLLLVGPRAGRFPDNQPPQKISGANIPLATLGVFLLWFGWFGFNGGSTLAMNEQVARVVANTVMAGAAGLVGALFAGWWWQGRAEVGLALNGSLAGLVAITANAHAVSALSAVLIGAVGGLVMLGCDHLLEQVRIDDAVSAIPVHLAAGVWGTLAVALFGQPALLGTGLSFGAQLQVQILGILVCGLWTFSLTYFLLALINRVIPLRVTAEEEHIGLNISEHGASTELLDLFAAMETQSRTGDLSLRVPVEPFTEIGQIAERYNRVMEALEGAVARTEAIIRTARDGIIIFSKNNLQIMPVLNPAAEAIFGYQGGQLRQRPITCLFETTESKPLEKALIETASGRDYREMTGRRADGSTFPLEFIVTEAAVGQESFYIGTFRDITERKQTEAELETYREHLEEQVAERSAELVAANQQLMAEIVERERAEEALRLTQFSVDHAADGVYWIGYEGEFLYVNKAACRMLGYSDAELLTMNIHQIDPNYPPDIWRSHWRNSQHGPITVESRHRAKNGQPFPVEVTFTYLEFNQTAYNFVFVRDITRRLWAVQALRESEDRFRQVISSISDHVYMIEMSREQRPAYQYISPKVEDITGYAAERLQSEPDLWPSTILHPEDSPIFEQQVERFLTGTDSEVEYRLVRRSGQVIWVRDSGQVKPHPTGQGVIVYGVVSDITERRQAAQALAQARDEALRASNFKSQLLATVSHELRTPLNAILGYTDMLQAGARGELTEKQLQVLQRIIINSDKLGSLINNLLIQAQMEQGRLTLQQSSFVPTALLTSLESVLGPTARAKGLLLIGQIDESLPDQLIGDVNRLQDILINLVGNAVKFTAVGEVRVRLFRPAADRWALAVSDTGPGIPADAQAAIFEPFRQVDGTTTRGYGGSGLGLSIVRELVTLMEGTLTVESEVGQGSTFTVRLPLINEE